GPRGFAVGHFAPQAEDVRPAVQRVLVYALVRPGFQLLRQVRHPRAGSNGQAASHGRQLANDGSQEAGLAAAVGAYHGQLLAGLQLEAEVAQDDLCAVGESQAVDRQEGHESQCREPAFSGDGPCQSWSETGNKSRRLRVLMSVRAVAVVEVNGEP